MTRQCSANLQVRLFNGSKDPYYCLMFDGERVNRYNKSHIKLMQNKGTNAA